MSEAMAVEDGSGATQPAAEEVGEHASENLTARGGLHPPNGVDLTALAGLTVPIIEVAYKNGKWWSIPQDVSAQMYALHTQGQDAVYAWDWGEDGRVGSWKHEGENTSINRYKIDFVSGIQTNLDNERKRSIRVAWVRRQDIEPQFTGQLPTDAQ